ncbi:tetratricopeptide repeat protein [Ramlibacter humi]|uniref:tetratricopeptide repeat protein n=1 Tax=Ramlibacter humi TaxID=2530451 RepID=UPI00142F9C3D|nr:tetratricopeptide repeat protein [Ramlibacter humi]
MPHDLFDFDDIHALLRAQQPRKALRRLLTPDGGLRAGYFYDKNHAWYCVGCAHFDLGNYPDARSAFRKALRADSSDLQCLLAIGNCYDAEGKPKLAEKAFLSGLAMNPNRTISAKFKLNLANALFDQDRDTEALTLYKGLARRRDLVGDRARANIDRLRKRRHPPLKAVVPNLDEPLKVHGRLQSSDLVDDLSRAKDGV